MPVPATTGQLRTKISDMEIGDYIKFNPDKNATPVKFIFGDDGGKPEFPINGMANDSSGNRTHLNYFAYMVKVAKGLLVSDRVIFHTLTWDAMNSQRWVQGIPMDNGNLIPAMTSNTSPSGVASASSSEGETWSPFRAFDGRYDTAGWVAGRVSGAVKLPQWLSYRLNEERKVIRYALRSLNNYNDQMPKNWIFQGFDGVDWIDLDVQNNITFTNDVTRYFDIKNDATYYQYRIYVTAHNGGAYLRIGELEMFDTVGIIRSLTGGVAYADENGNKSLTDKGFGAFPVNNEWDRYIVNFPPQLIQEGKTLDDVIHIKTMYTWCQDTPINGTWTDINGTVNTNNNRSGQRICRGNIDRGVWNNIAGRPSTDTNIDNGFRPIFEFKEV